MFYPRTNPSPGPEFASHVIRGDLDQIVLKAVARDRAQRYDSAEDFARDVERWIRHEPVHARPATFAYRARKFFERHTRAVLAVAAGALILAGVSVYYARRLAAERDRAQLAAQRAARVSELLTGVMSAPDPFRTTTKGDPMSGLFATTIEQAKRELADEPALRAPILTAVGRVYLRLGQHAPAQAALIDAISAARASDPHGAPLAQALSQMGVLARERGEFCAAQNYFGEALEVLRTAPGVEPNDLAIALVELGRTYLSLEQFSDAERVFSEALEIRRRALGEEHRETAVSYGDLGQALWYQGRLDEARPLLVKCIELHRRTLGEEHANVALSLGNLALLERDRGDFAAAEAIYRDAVPMAKRTLGARHWRVARQLGNLAYLRTLKGRLDEALPIAQESAGGDRSLEAGLKIERARIHLLRGEAAVAEPLLRDALGALRRSYPEHGWRIAAVKSLLGGALTELGRFAEAEAFLLEAEKALPRRPLRPRNRSESRTARASLRTLGPSGPSGASSRLARSTTPRRRDT
jgi:tetratricopeptide (TPR) repeat protein